MTPLPASLGKPITLFKFRSKRWLRSPLNQSIGSRLFLYVLSGALVGLGGMSYFFYQAAENRAKEQVRERLSTQVQSIAGQLVEVEVSMSGLAAAAKTMHSTGTKEASTYKQLTFEFFQQRPDLVMGLGFGQTPNSIVGDREWYWPYFYVDQGVAGAVGQFLPAPHSNLRYSDLFVDDNYSQKEYYTVPVAGRKAVWVEPYDWYGITITSFLSPFFDANGKMIGVAGADVNVTALAEQIKAPVMQDGGNFAILSAQGNLLAYPPNPNQAKIRASYQNVPELRQVWPQLQRGQAGLVQFQGTWWAYQRIPQTNWLMLAAVPQALVLGPVLQITIAGALGAGAILALVVALFVRRLNDRLRPILEECHKLRAIEAEKTDAGGQEATDEALHPSGADMQLAGLDEISILSLSFHQMSQQLRDSFTALEKTNEELEFRVAQRTEELHQNNDHLQATLLELRQAQSQLVHSEKMSSLGQLVAGVAHEINNPVNFIHGNLVHASQYTQDLLELLASYQAQFPNATPELLAQAEEIDLEFLQEDLPKLLASMKVGADRIRDIVQSLRNFSRLDEAEVKDVDIHEGIDSTLMILQNRLKAKPEHPAIQVVKEYGNLPPVECYSGQLNQVFMNILTNALDALDEYQAKLAATGTKPAATITIRTVKVGRDRIAVYIADNGPGMSAAVQQRLLDPFFTTKPVGKGTGLGMSISYQIVVEKHGGSLQCVSALGEGTEFVIEIPIRQSKTQSSARQAAIAHAD
uniref:ATP-binding protein n=1 Tax=Trichocoleus desertorum TaxID=1481672 RepID=UPI0025B39D50|nr:ATP-binding protein [Trichocoleus desertorum]